MIDKTLSYLDYLKLIDIFFRFSSTPFIKDLIDNLKPLQDKTAIINRQDCIEAVLEVIKWDGKMPLSDIPDIAQVIKRLSVKDSTLEEQELLLLAGFASASDSIIFFLQKVYSKKPYIEKMLESMKQLSSVAKKISRAINPEGFIEDSASYELSRIRMELFGLRERVNKYLERVMDREMVRPVLQDSYIALRNNRYVIPLKPNFNEAIQGIVHDYSHSLKTSFVEPVECVEMNNSINILVNEEKEEEKKVLKDLTDFARSSREIMEMNLNAIKELDFYHTLALFCLEFHCVRPEITDGGSMEIKGALNPFIMLSKKQEAVPIDIVMKDDQKVMIISGPNAGGKTAALKTMGLLSVMATTGLFIPASGIPLIPLFPNIFALIGDEQDISMELSSFTAHMQAIKDLYSHASGNELVLIDEIGGATEPQEASALAMAIIDAFVERGCKVIVTTHLNLIKAYGYKKDFAINVSTSFDVEKMRPLYRLTYGTAGYSNAIKVAKNIDVPMDIIEKSYAYLGKQEYMLNDLITSLESEKKAAEEERDALVKLKDEAKKRLALIRDKRDEYERKVEERCSARLQELEIEIEEIKREVARKDRASVTKGKRQLQTIRERFTGTAVANEEDIRVGDYVFVKTLGGKGRVVDIDKEREVFEVALGNVRTQLKRFMIEKTVADRKQPTTVKDRVDVEKVESIELNLIGMRVEEALNRLDRFLDRAVVDGVSQVRILHGIGTGRLMSAVGEHLTGAPFIKSLRKDERNSGVTIVEFA